ncbi:endoglucanase [Spirochaetia bacterium]|nr:endoglucanase [Spirochaetia bacterium]
MKNHVAYITALSAAPVIGILAAVLLIAACNTTVCNESREPGSPEAAFSRGVNFSGWFEASSPRRISFTKFTEQDFADARGLGSGIIRLPINLHAMTGGAPEYTLDPLFLEFLDQAVDWAEKYGLYIILDNHSFDPVAATADDIDQILIPVWRQLAAHYKDRGAYVLYEVLNEPHGISAERWGVIQGEAIEAIRAIDPVHTIIAGGVGYNSIDGLSSLPEYTDPNIIYTFHFYDPYLFTHQGETWGSPPNLANLRGIPFPSNAHSMPPIPDEYKNTWIADSLKYSYANDAKAATLAAALDRAVKFSTDRGGVPLFCGEFGVYMINSLNEDRVRWYRTVTELLDKRDISRTSWDYTGGFGLFKTPGARDIHSELNVDVARALGFTPPPRR